jgi:hypothetical protein
LVAITDDTATTARVPDPAGQLRQGGGHHGTARTGELPRLPSRRDHPLLRRRRRQHARAVWRGGSRRASSSGSSVVLAWGMDREEDRLGNYLTVTYSLATVDLDLGGLGYEWHPTQIDYTGNTASGRKARPVGGVFLQPGPGGPGHPPRSHLGLRERLPAPRPPSSSARSP